MKIGVSSYSYSRLVHAGDLAQIAVPKTAREMGFDVIEFEGLEDVMTGVELGHSNLRRFVDNVYSRG